MIMLLTGDETRDAEYILNFKLNQESATTHNAKIILTRPRAAKPSWAPKLVSSREATKHTTPIEITNRARGAGCLFFGQILFSSMFDSPKLLISNRN